MVLQGLIEFTESLTSQVELRSGRVEARYTRPLLSLTRSLFAGYVGWFDGISVTNGSD
jgi:hypothetical protein